MPLFTSNDLTHLLGEQVPYEAAVMAERVVDGWLKSDTGLREWPKPLPPEVFSWAVELGAIIYENPTALTTRASGDESDSYAVGRRDAIRAEARAWEGGTGAHRAGVPRGTFPPVTSWPDGAGDRFGRW